MQKKGLGRGLGALIPDININTSDDSPNVQADIGKIIPNSLQPRRSFDDTKIDQLATSIRDKGIIQPLLVRPNGNGYELIAGERRLRAALKAGLKEVPIIVREASDTDALQLALIENLQREDLNPIEEASAYQRLHEEFNLSQEEVADKVGKSRPAIANSMRLLLLPKEVQHEVAQGNLPGGQARALLGLASEPLILTVAREVIAKGLSARETEKLVRHLKSGRKRRMQLPASDPNLRSIVENLQRSLGTKVRIIHGARTGKGKIEIEYYSRQDLERLIGVMSTTQN